MYRIKLQETNKQKRKRRETLYYDSSFIKQIKYKRSSDACCPRYIVESGL